MYRIYETKGENADILHCDPYAARLIDEYKTKSEALDAAMKYKSIAEYQSQKITISIWGDLNVIIV